jgi:hypothetical protein
MGYRFSVAAYAHAGFLYHTDMEQVERGSKYFSRYCPLDKVYLETHRGLYDVPGDKKDQVKALFAGGLRSPGELPARSRLRGCTNPLTVAGILNGSYRFFKLGKA